MTWSEYDQLKYDIYYDLRRRVLIDNRTTSACEGQGFKQHYCNGELELNHVLIARNVFQKLPAPFRKYFDHEINCALNCPFFHRVHGHTKAYEAWHRERVDFIYGEDIVEEWLRSAPLDVVFETEFTVHAR